MYNAEFIQQLKQTNVSADGEKTKERVEKLWKSASGEQKMQIEQDAGSARSSIYRVYNTGSISAKIALSFAQRLNADPYYLTGETDENNGYSDETARRFLKDKGYSKLFDDFTSAAPKKRAYKKKTVLDSDNKPEETPDAAPGEETVKDGTEPSREIKEAETAAPSNAGNENDLAEITEEDMISILHSLFIRARVNKEAGELLSKIKYMLVY